MDSNSFRQTVFVVDDDAAVLGALKFLLRSVGLAAELYSSGPEFLAAYCDDRPGCLLLDRTMPVMSGLEVLHRLNERQSILPTIFMAACGDVQIAGTAMRAGAVNFIEKPFREQVLLDAIQHALDRDRANRQALSDRPEIIRRLTSLTPREHEVLDLLVQGHSSTSVAEQLEISRRAAQIHHDRIVTKLSASSLAHLLRMVRRAAEEGGT